MSLPRLAYLLTHPIQYQAPLLRLLTEDARVALKVFYGSDFSAQAFESDCYNTRISWDIPVLEGHAYELLPGIGNHKPVGLLKPWNVGLGRRLRREGIDLLWVHGYARPYHLLAMAEAKVLGIKVLLRDEATDVSAPRSPGRQRVKRLYFAALKRLVDSYLAIGRLNADYYRGFGIPAERIDSCPYVVDNGFFAERARQAVTDPTRNREALLRGLGLDPVRPVILFTARLIARKRAEDVIEACAALQGRWEGRDPQLLVVGDGEERERLETLAREKDAAICFAGFRNQTELPAFYAACDVFVLPSAHEPWGLVVNEVMNAGKAVIVTDQVGAGGDLVANGVNGFVYPTGDVAALTEALTRVLADPTTIQAFGQASATRIAQWGLREAAEGIYAAARRLGFPC